MLAAHAGALCFTTCFQAVLQRLIQTASITTGPETQMLLQKHHDAAGGLQAQAERRDIQQQQVLHLLAALAAQDRRLSKHAQ